jgi:hypothetical protein
MFSESYITLLILFYNFVQNHNNPCFDVKDLNN